MGRIEGPLSATSYHLRVPKNMLLPDLKRVRLLDSGRMGSDDNKIDVFAQRDKYMRTRIFDSLFTRLTWLDAAAIAAIAAYLPTDKIDDRPALFAKPTVALFAVSMLTLMLFAWPVLAQNAEDEGTTDPAPNLELFDDDVEHTREGWPQLYVSAGFMTLDADGIFSVRPPLGNDVTIIDFDRVGLNESDSSYWLTIKWRSSNSRWGAWFGSWQYDVIGSRIWQNSLPLPDGGEIPVGASVTSSFDAQWFILEATYSFYRSESLDAGIGFGLHSVDLDTSLTARVQIGGQESEVISGNLGTLAPLPNVLTYASWKVAPKWMLIARLGYFTLDYDKFAGHMLNAHGMVNYSLSERWSLGVGYQFVHLDLVIDQTNYVEIYDLDFEGPMAYARFRF